MAAEIPQQEPGFAELLHAVQSRAGDADFDLAIVLGSGLGALSAEVAASSSFPYRDFSCFPAGQVAGHSGCLVVGTLLGWRVLLFAGRHHLYQGLTGYQVTLPARLAHALGCRRLLLTNAVGGIRETFAPGDFMFIEDHLNLLGDNPLRALPDSFIDLSRLYRRELFLPLLTWARQAAIPLHSGILAAVPGPSYETPAEIRMLRLLGADVVSMSTVPEAIMGKYLGMEVAGLSLVANRAAGTGPPLRHAEVLQVADRSARNFIDLCLHLISLWQSPLGSHG
ncbi:MAG: purine-nucleoside phosphorylase [Desulfuromonadales bacterium]